MRPLLSGTCMFGALAKSIYGSSNDRYVKSLGKTVEQIASFEPTISAMTDEELAAQTVRFRERLAQGETLDALLPEAFATVPIGRESCRDRLCRSVKYPVVGVSLKKK